MSINTRDKNGYPLEGIDVVPIRPKKPNKMTELMKLLQEANRREEKERENAEYWRRAYHRVNQDYIALQFEDLCSECKQVKAEQIPVKPTSSANLVIEDEKRSGL